MWPKRLKNINIKYCIHPLISDVGKRSGGPPVIISEFTPASLRILLSARRMKSIPKEPTKSVGILYIYGPKPRGDYVTPT